MAFWDAAGTRTEPGACGKLMAVLPKEPAEDMGRQWP